MKKFKYGGFTTLTVIIATVLIAVCFFVSIIIVEEYAKQDCFQNIEEATDQVSDMFSHALVQSQNQLSLFADILAVTSELTEEQLQIYMENFCDTQNFSAVCLHSEDGTLHSQGFHPSEQMHTSFASEVSKLPYISDVHGSGVKRSEQYIYLAVPVIREAQTIAVLYGYISLETFPSFISSTAYDGKCQFYIVDGNTGDFLMDEYHRYGKDSPEEIPLGNAFDGSMGDRETKPGYDLDAMRQGMRNGIKGFFIFKSQRTGEWYYTHFAPMGINNWSMQITIDEPTAFATYYYVRDGVLGLMIAVVVLSLIIVVVLIAQSRKRLEREEQHLHKSEYVNSVQAALISAHNNPDFVAKALKLVAGENKAEKALLLTISEHIIGNIYYWPSLDMNKAKVLIGVNIQEEFPVMFDTLASGESFFCDEEIIDSRFTPKAKALFQAIGIFNILMVPVLDNTGTLRGAIAAINISGQAGSSEMLECVSRDFFMAIANLESHNIIKRMGTMDYMTGLKNRNSYEAEIADYENTEAENLWCIFVDVNGLHELNNSQGHQAGDRMICAVADAMKKVFGADRTYRLGGDEFVAFRLNCSHEEMLRCKNRIQQELNRKGYSVSVGFDSTRKNESGMFDVQDLTSRAEGIMYQGKWKYYEQNNIPTDRKYMLPEVREKEASRNQEAV